MKAAYRNTSYNLVSGLLLYVESPKSMYHFKQVLSTHMLLSTGHLPTNTCSRAYTLIYACHDYYGC